MNKLLVLFVCFLLLGCSAPEAQDRDVPTDDLMQEKSDDTPVVEESGEDEEKHKLQPDGGLDEALEELDILNELDSQ